MEELKCPECEGELTLVCVEEQWVDYYIDYDGKIDWGTGESEDGSEELDRMLRCGNCGEKYDVDMTDNDIVDIGKKREQSSFDMMNSLLDRAKNSLSNVEDFYVSCLREFISRSYIPHSLVVNMEKLLDGKIKEASRRDV